MSDIAQVSLASRLFHMPRFEADAQRTPGKAFLHALPAFFYLALNVWIAGMGAAWSISMLLPLPLSADLAIAGVFAVPCVALSWTLLVMCIETEATLLD